MTSKNQELIELSDEFLEAYYADEIEELARLYPREQQALVVEWSDLLAYDDAVADDYINHPEYIARHLNDALTHFEISIDVDLADAEVRVTGLHESREYAVDEYLPRNIDEALAVTGQISQSSQSKPEITRAVFDCTRCGNSTEIPQLPGSTDMEEPHECVGCERQGPFRLNKAQSEFQDSQLLRVKQPPEMSQSEGSHIDVEIRGDLASSGLTGGERVTATGVLSIDETDTDETVFDYYLDCDDVEVHDGGYEDIDPDDYRDEIDAIRTADDPVQSLVDNFAPGIEADQKLQDIQEALVLQMIGTAAKHPEGGERLRGDSHMLLLGDPGVGKSMMFEEVEKLAPRSKYMSGEGVTAAGMTAAAVRHDFGPGGWKLEPGLMVLANNGTAILDEIDKADDSAINSMHQALENQRVTVSKGGINAELPAKTALLAGGNPKYGRFDQYEPFADQIDLTPALMSRFDVMFMMPDIVEFERDSAIAGSVVGDWSEAGIEEHTDEDIVRQAARPICDDQDRAVNALRAYVAEAKDTVNPVIRSDEVKERLKKAYLDVRVKGADDDSPVPITARKLEAFLRFAESSARARFSDEVEVQDVERSIRLIMSSLEDVGVDPETGEFDADMIETGESKAQRDRVKTVLTVIEELEAEYDSGAPVEAVVEAATADGVDESKVKSGIGKLKKKGEVYEPATGHLRVST